MIVHSHSSLLHHFIFRVGKKVEETLRGFRLNANDAPCSILLPASHGPGLAFTLLIQFLMEHHNMAIRTLDNKHPTVVRCQEIVDSSMLAAFDARDIQLALVANSEYQINADASLSQSTSWTINKRGLEQQVIDRFEIFKVCFGPISRRSSKRKVLNFYNNRGVGS